jgi:monoterpene epsilon-lactone hydrolase
MPSAESNALRAHLQTMSQRMSAQPDLDILTMRDIAETLSTLQREPTGVTYEETYELPVPALWVRPLDAVVDRVILYLHGGGYVTHSMYSSRKLIGHLAKASRSVALVPDYRLAPENPYPAQLDDAMASYEWLLDHGFSADRIVVAGESAGGNLSAALIVRLSQEGRPVPAGFVGFSPWFDLLGESAPFDRHPSTDAFLSREASSGMAQLYMGEAGDPHDPLINPRFADLTGFPPTYVTAGAEENLVDSIQTFADAAQSAGVEVALEIAEGQQHAFQWMAGRAPEADASIAAAGDWIQTQMGAGAARTV